MTRLWYVVDTVTGDRFEPGHPDEGDAYRAMVDRYVNRDDDSPGRYDVEADNADGPVGYVLHGQSAATITN